MWAIIDYLNLEGVKELWSKITSHVKSVTDTKADMIHASQHASDGPDPITPDSIGLGNSIQYLEKVSNYTPFPGEGGIINNIFSVNRKIILIGFGDDTKSFKYSEDGFRWEDLEFPVACGFYSNMAYANGRFLLNLDQRNDEFLYSDDGKAWTTVAAGPAYDGTKEILSTGEKFFYPAPYNYDNPSIYISSDGIEWTQVFVNTYRVSSIYQIVVFNNKIIAPIGEYGTLICNDINDLSTWTLEPSDVNIGNKIMFANGIFVSTNYNSSTSNTEIFYSKDGKKWYDSGFKISGSPSDYVCGNGIFIIRKMKDIYYSVDGQHWNTTTVSYNVNALNKMIYSNGKFFMFGISSYASEKILVSSNGIDWTKTMTYKVLETASGNDVTNDIKDLILGDLESVLAKI